MLALAHTLLVENLWDRDFVARYCTGFDIFERYLLGRDDDTPKDAAWAADITGIPAADDRRPRPPAAARAHLDHGLAFAAAGAIWRAAGVDGRGARGHARPDRPARRRIQLRARRARPHRPPAQRRSDSDAAAGQERRQRFHPGGARQPTCCCNPGEPFDYNGRSMRYPDIKLVYWAGGNPFHHHQDINRLRRAFNVPQTIVVHESAWTPMAKFADIVLPATMTLERDDIGAAGTDPRLVAMRKAVDPVGEARDDFDIFAALSRRLGVEQAFTEGRNSRQWLAHLYEPTRRALADAGWDAPDFDEFWQRGELALPSAPDDGGFLRAFRNDPVKQQAADAERQDRDPFEDHRRLRLRRLPAPPGLAALDRTAGFAPPADADRQPAGDPAAQPARLRRLQPVKENRRPRSRPPQPRRCGAPRHRRWRHRPPVQRSRRVPGRRRRLQTTSCPAWCNCPPAPGTIREPARQEHPLCVHGNPNVLTRDIGTSRLAQGCCGQVTVVECEKYQGALPPVRAFDPPDQHPWNPA